MILIAMIVVIMKIAVDGCDDIETDSWYDSFVFDFLG